MQGLVRVTQNAVLSSCTAGPAQAYALQSTGWFGVGKSGKGSGKHVHKDVISGTEILTSKFVVGFYRNMCIYCLPRKLTN